MNGIKVALYCLVSLLTLPVKVQAQTPLSVPPLPKPVTLASTLALAVPPKSSLILTVGADTLTLPDGETPPPAKLTVPAIAQGFGQETRRFGSVMAIGPPTMTILNEHPSGGDPLADVSGSTVLKMLMASLSDAQWKALTSENGLGLSDLTSEKQQIYFRALFRHGMFLVCPTPAPGMPQDKDSLRDLTDEIPQTRIRLSQSVRFAIPLQSPNDANGAFIPSAYQSAAQGTAKYQIYQDTLPPKTTIDGVQVSAEVPNTPKHGQLDLKALAFQVSVPLNGLKMVSDLIERISQQTHLEMYADAHYAQRSLILIGPAKTACAFDLLRALGWSLTAAWRKVGPAYVLTDDVIGVGTRREILSQYHDQMTDTLSPLINTASDTIFTKHSARSLPTFGDPLAATSGQLAVDKSTADNSGTIFPEIPFSKNQFFSDLSSTQQEAVHKIVDAYQQSQADHVAQKPGTQPDLISGEIITDPSYKPDLSGKITVDPSYRLEATVPGLDGEVNLQPDITNLAALFWPGSRVFDARYAPYQAEEAKQEAAKHAPPKHTIPDLDSFLATISRRALLAAPQTPQDVDTLIRAMSKSGLNELWLTVFTRGHAHLDILTEAIKDGRKAKIAIFPIVDLLNWDSTVAGADADLNLLGQTSEQAAAERIAQAAASPQTGDPSVNSPIFPPPHLDAVSPFVPDVQIRLAEMLRSLAARPGIAGIIWQDTDCGNYDMEQHKDSGDPTYLGYTETARLAFLRKYQSDPVDILPGSSIPFLSSTHLPKFDDYPVEDTLHNDWQVFRNQQEISFLQILAGVIEQTRPMPLFIKSRNTLDNDGWFGSWDGPHAPISSSNPSPDGSGASWADMSKQAKQQSKVSLVLVTRPPIPDSKSLAAVLDDACDGKSWNGFVLDDTGDKDQTWLKSLAAQCKP